MRHSNFYEEYSLVAVLFLFSECAARSLVFPFSFRLSRAAETGKGERRKSRGQTCENAKMPRGMRRNLPATIHTCRIFSAPSHFFPFFFSSFPFPFVKSQTSVVAKSSVLCTYNRNRGSAQFCEGISPGSGVFTEDYNFTAMYNLRPQESLCLSAVRSLCERSIC